MLNLVDTQKLITLRAKLRWNLLHYVYRETYPKSHYSYNTKNISYNEIKSMGLILIDKYDNIDIENEIVNAISYLQDTKYLTDLSFNLTETNPNTTITFNGVQKH